MHALNRIARVAERKHRRYCRARENRASSGGGIVFEVRRGETSVSYWKSPAYDHPPSLPKLSIVTLTVFVGFCAETAVNAIEFVLGVAL